VKSNFAGWDEVAGHLMETASPSSPSASLLNDGQRASLRAIATRIASNGIVVADEVGMGKSRIAAYVANAVTRSRGRCAILIPPGLGFQWQAEFRACGTYVPPVIRSLKGYYDAWDETESDTRTIAPWFEQSVVMVSHRFSDWRLGSNPHPWRWWLLPEVYAAARQLTDGRLPRFYRDANEYAGEARVQRVVAAAWSMTQAVPRSPSHPARRLLKELLEVRWPEPLEPHRYGRNGVLRKLLENVVGLGLGVFDLIIVDEAHKSRDDDSGLSRVLDNIVLKGNESRRIALTATPIELDVAQWESTLKRIAVRSDQMETVTTATEHYAEAIRRLRLGWRASAELRSHYVDASREFQSALSPYLIRRDKREDEDVLKFARVSRLPIHDYRRQEEIAVEFDDLSPAWRQAVCAAEALSLTDGPAIDSRTRRLRLTIGNGHGIASVIDENLHDANEDRKQDAFEASQSELAPKNEAPVTDRAAWWMDTLRRAFPDDQELLFEHPAILAAIRYIEHQTEIGEKVLVFGRFTRPLRALVSLLNARQMLLRVGKGEAWPQRKVHGDRNGIYGDSEWPAVLAAHRQLSSPVVLDTLDDVLAERYRRDSELRVKVRDTMIPRIRAGLPGATTNSTKYDAILRIVELQSQQATDDPDDDDRQLTLLARAITANLDNTDASNADIASAFIALVNAAGDQDHADEEQFDEEAASFAWQSLEEHLGEGYTNRQGGYARLMYGETKPQARRMMQLAFNRSNSFPRVLVTQSLVGREGLNLHESCRIVVLLHPEWNPGVVEQQIGRVDRVNCRWAKELNRAIDEGKTGSDLPRIEIRPVIFKGTYDEHNWRVLRERWDDLRAQLHGEAIPARLRADEDEEGRLILEQITQSRPEFSPLKREHGDSR
jgi:hypothetical protein